MDGKVQSVVLITVVQSQGGGGVGGREQATNEKHTDRKREGERSRLEISCTCKFAHNI